MYRRIWFLVCLIFAVPFDATAQNRMLKVVGVAADDPLNVRTGPGVQFEDIGDLQLGEEVPWLGVGPAKKWALIEYRGRQAYASLKYLEYVRAQPAVSTPEPTAARFNVNPDGTVERFRPDGSGTVWDPERGITALIRPDGTRIPIAPVTVVPATPPNLPSDWNDWAANLTQSLDSLLVNILAEDDAGVVLARAPSDFYEGLRYKIGFLAFATAE